MGAMYRSERFVESIHFGGNLQRFAFRLDVRGEPQELPGDPSCASISATGWPGACHSEVCARPNHPQNSGTRLPTRAFGSVNRRKPGTREFWN